MIELLPMPRLSGSLLDFGKTRFLECGLLIPLQGVPDT